MVDNPGFGTFISQKLAALRPWMRRRITFGSWRHHKQRRIGRANLMS
jgi:hypothetical protein